MCGAEESKIIDALSHNFSTEWTIDVEPTCTTDGSKSRHCLLCGEIEYETLPALGHDFSTEWTIDVEATCSDEGLKSHHCTRCDARTDVTIIEFSDHRYGEITYLVEPTCTQGGTGYHTCDICGYFEYVNTDPQHKFGEWQVVIEPTFESEGQKERVCEGCGETKTESISALNTVLGDINGDGAIDYGDYNIIIAIATLAYAPTEEESAKADINQDGTVDALDAIYLDIYLAGMLGNTVSVNTQMVAIIPKQDEENE